MSEFLEPPPIRRTVSTPSVDFHHHLATYFDPSTPLSGVPEDAEQDTVTPNMIFLSNNEMDMPSTPLNRSYSMPYYAAAMQQQQQQHHHIPAGQNYSLTPGHSSPYQQPAFRANKSFYTPIQVNGLMTPVSSSHAMRTNSSPSICASAASSNGANAFLTPMTPSNTVPTFKDHTGVKLEFDSMSGSATARSTPASPGGVNPFYSPPSYMMNSMTSVTNPNTSTTPPNDRKLQVASAAAQALDVRSFTPPEFNTACLTSDSSNVSAMIPSPASSTEYQEFLDSVNPLDKSALPMLVRPQPKRLHRAGSYNMAGGPMGHIPATPTPMSGVTKPHRCDSCHKSFRRLEHLKRHMKIHTAERPFICDVLSCNRKFSRSDNLRAHRRTHMKEGGRNAFVKNLPEI